MNLKNRIIKLESRSINQTPLRMLFYVVGEQTLEEAKAQRGWQHIPDNQLRIICFEVVE